MVVKHNVADLMESFRKTRSQLDDGGTVKRTKRKSTAEKKSGGNSQSDLYTKFRRKYEDLASYIDSFTATDLCFYFREKAEEADIRYEIVSYGRDVGALKNALKHYSARELCLMIEFIFLSDQNYLTKEGLCPTILVSGWTNKLYNDSIAWANDSYVPDKVKPKKVSREWTKTTDKDEAKIGEW